MLCSDVPIQKAQEDILNRRSFVQSLAEVIVGYDAPESFSIGVYGPWGSGKTSVINMTIEAVESTSSDIVTLRFNPWLCSDAKQLITQFFKQLASAVQLKETNSDKLWRLIDSYSDVLEITGAFGTAGVFCRRWRSSLREKPRCTQRAMKTIFRRRKMRSLRI